MFPSKRITALESQVADLNSSLSTITIERDALLKQIAGVITPDAHAAVVLERDNALGEVGTLRARVTELEATAATAGRQAADIVSSVAVPPVAADAGSQAPIQTAEEIRAEFDAEHDPKKRAAIWSRLQAAMK